MSQHGNSVTYVASDSQGLKQKQESTVPRNLSWQNANNSSSTNMIRTVADPMNLFYSSDSDDDSVCVMHIEDGVNIHGVSARGIIDSGADNSIRYQFIGWKSYSAAYKMYIGLNITCRIFRIV